MRARPAPAAPRDPEAAAPERRELETFLAGELRLPLAALSRLGARCAAEPDPDLAATGRAIARECQRLDVVVTNALELGLMNPEPAAGRGVDVSAVVERVVSGHRSLIEGLSVRVRVCDAASRATVDVDRAELEECLSALLADLLERVPRGGRVELRVRELLGMARVDCSTRLAGSGGAADRPVGARARELAERAGGEAWELRGEERGFGLAIPLWPASASTGAVVRRERKAVPIAC